MPSLSVVIITLNEERTIGRCLDSLKSIADDIVVVDSRSTDETEAICRGQGAHFIQRTWEGYSPAKNFGNERARYDLVLSIDADEALSPELQRSIAAMKDAPKAEAYKFARLTNYCGSWIRHGGWYPDIKIRIFDRRRARWEGAIHERLIGIDDTAAKLLHGDCLHFSYYSIGEHLRQARRFTDLAAQELFSRRKKSSTARLVVNPCMKFIRDYFLRLGCLDGRKGIVICAISAYATYCKYAKLSRLYAAERNTR